VPSGTPLDVLLFHGSPDIVIMRSKPTEIGDEDWQLCDKITGCIENKKQDKMAVCKENDMISQQVDQLVTYIHQMLILLTLANLVANKNCTSVKGSGLFIMRAQAFHQTRQLHD